MNGGEKTYIWQLGDWPVWRYDLAALAGLMAEVNVKEPLPKASRFLA